MLKTQFAFKTVKPGPKSKRPSREELFNYRKTHTASDAAKHFGVSRASIYRWTTEYLHQLELEALQNGD